MVKCSMMRQTVNCSVADVGANAECCTWNIMTKHSVSICIEEDWYRNNVIEMNGKSKWEKMKMETNEGAPFSDFVLVLVLGGEWQKAWRVFFSLSLWLCSLLVVSHREVAALLLKLIHIRPVGMNGGTRSQSQHQIHQQIWCHRYK